MVSPAQTSPLAWSALAPSPTTLYEGQGTAAEGRLYVIGGFDHNDGQDPIATAAVHVYDPATDTWTTRHDAPEAITHAGVAADGQDLYVAGGFIGDHPGPDTDHVWRYDTRADTWTAMPPLPSPRGAGALVRVGRTLHYVGGTERDASGTDVRDDADHFVLSLDAPTMWHTAAPLPRARNHLGAAVLDGVIYVVGGQHLGDEAYGDVTEVERYDSATDTWTAVAPLPVPLGHVSASTVVWNSKVLAIGGVTTATHAGAIEGEEVGSVFAYDPATNTWSALTSLPGPRQSPVADVIGGALIVTTGSTAQGPVADTWQGR
ncbi:hypothetical protein GCM10017781_12700 [Deinococcus metalli]|uniref:Galactose oxidase n=1 Tax=Deinococcus metalli TaxID=1141878 RepID=A0ABQ3JQZ4_9DEIO|nr:hypothetical protein GCM10017781_12700 [Deinococcus metalli]